MQNDDGSGLDEAFVEDGDATFDPDDHYGLLEVASGRTAIPADSDLHWVSGGHFVGRFWVVRPREGRPEIVSYRTPFRDAEVLDDAFLGLHPSMSFERCWELLQQGVQHLTPHQRACVDGTRADAWPRGHVIYAPREHTWLVRVAADLVDDDPTMLSIRQRFVIDPDCCRVAGDERLN
jgi:hypothetical protein